MFFLTFRVRQLYAFLLQVIVIFLPFHVPRPRLRMVRLVRCDTGLADDLCSAFFVCVLVNYFLSIILVLLQRNLTALVRSLFFQGPLPPLSRPAV